MQHTIDTMTRRAVLRSGTAAGMAAFAGRAAAANATGTDWQALAESVRAEMAWAFDAYRRLAWGADEIRPVSGTGRSFLIEGQKVGLSLIEALDTLWLMGLDAQVEDAVRWIKTDLRFDLDGDAQIFEATIRLVGGLLSGHLATGETVLLEKAHDLAERMLPGYDTPTGMPVRYINLKTGKTRGTHSFPAEVGGGSGPEFVTLSRLTGDRKFADAAVNAMLALYERRSPLGLIGDTIDVTTGKWLSGRATIAPPSDAYYEYLWDTWRLTGDTRLRDAYATLTAAVKAHSPIVRQVNCGSRTPISRREGESTSRNRCCRPSMRACCRRAAIMPRESPTYAPGSARRGRSGSSPKASTRAIGRSRRRPTPFGPSWSIRR